jgi:hypothetical protein
MSAREQPLKSTLNCGTMVGFLTTMGLLANTGTVVAQEDARSLSQASFASDVAPILYEKCVVCHRPGSIAPMSLLDYETAKQYAPLIKMQVENRKMPPWFIDHTVGIQEFKDDRSLSDLEIATIAGWVEAGAPQGDPSNMPPVPTFDDEIYEWTLEDEIGRPPDLIVSIPEPFTVQAGVPNLFMDFVSSTGLTEDRWIKAHETKPSLEGFPVVHHATTQMRFPDGKQVNFSEYALGKTGDIFPDGSGLLMKAGTELEWNLHYAAYSEDRTDRTRIALWFYPKDYEPEHEIHRAAMGNLIDLDLPPGQDEIRHDGYHVLSENIRITVFQPHLHNLGSRQCMEVIYPDNRRQTLNCAFWDFGWHLAYNYAEEAEPLIPKGSVIHVLSWHNNSESNPWAGDPDNWVGFGQRSSDDMSFTHVSYYTLSDEEYAEHVEERLAQFMAEANDQ